MTNRNESDENIAESDHEPTEFEGEYADNIRIMKGETIDALVKVTDIDMTAREALLKMKKISIILNYYLCQKFCFKRNMQYKNYFDWTKPIDICKCKSPSDKVWNKTEEKTKGSSPNNKTRWK